MEQTWEKAQVDFVSLPRPPPLRLLRLPAIARRVLATKPAATDLRGKHSECTAEVVPAHLVAASLLEAAAAAAAVRRLTVPQLARLLQRLRRLRWLLRGRTLAVAEAVPRS